MNFDLTEDQTMLRSAVERYVADHGGIDNRRLGRRTASGFSQDNWSTLASLGLVAAPLPEAVGGMALGAADIAVVFQELGRGLAAEPMADSIVGAACTFARCAEPELLGEWANDLATGSKRLAFALNERATRYNICTAKTRVCGDQHGPNLSGEKVAVANAVGADAFIVSAVDGDGTIGLYLVAGDASGLELHPYRQIDDSVAAVLALREVRPLANLSGGAGEIREADARISFAHSAEAIGIMGFLFDATLDHLKQREQFGQSLGRFQAIQHRMSAQYVALEQARSLLYWAIARAEDGGRLGAIAGLRSFVLSAAIDLGHEAIQLHGGMGVTDELAIGHAHKRLVQIARAGEPPELALDRYAGLLN